MLFLNSSCAKVTLVPLQAAFFPYSSSTLVCLSISVSPAVYILQCNSPAYTAVHTSLVKCCKVRWLPGVRSLPALHPAAVSPSAIAGTELRHPALLLWSRVTSPPVHLYFTLPQVDLSQDTRGKAAVSRTGTKPKAKGVQDQVSKLQQDLEDSRRLVTSLREEVGQKETIAAMAVGQAKVRH